MSATGLDKLLQDISDVITEAEVDYPAGREAGPRISFDENAIKTLVANHLTAVSPRAGAVEWPLGEAEVLIYDPRGDIHAKREPHKIIDASLAFFDKAQVGERLYSKDQVEEILSALGPDPSEAEVATSAAEQIKGICAELGCTTTPGVAVRFVKELRRDLTRAHERHIELLRSWDAANLTERQELDRLRRGWGPSSPTERMARRMDLRAAMTVIERAMDAVLPDDKEDEDLTLAHFQTAYDHLSEGYRAIIALIQAIPDLTDPDVPTHLELPKAGG